MIWRVVSLRTLQLPNGCLILLWRCGNRRNQLLRMPCGRSFRSMPHQFQKAMFSMNYRWRSSTPPNLVASKVRSTSGCLWFIPQLCALEIWKSDRYFLWLWRDVHKEHDATEESRKKSWRNYNLLRGHESYPKGSLRRMTSSLLPRTNKGSETLRNMLTVSAEEKLSITLNQRWRWWSYSDDSRRICSAKDHSTCRRLHWLTCHWWDGCVLYFKPKPLKV